MIFLLLAALFLAGILAGAFAGYVLAVSRTDRTLAAMSEDELHALAARVRERRKG